MALRRVSVLLVVQVALYAAPVCGDTLGYLPAMKFAGEYTVAKPLGKARVVVARTPAEWAVAWKAAGGRGRPAAVDFERDMIVGVVNGAKRDRVIYRSMLNDGGKPTHLEVHLGYAEAPTWTGYTRKGVGAQFVVSARSALSVRFVFDDMTDGRLFGMDGFEEGVASREVALMPGVTVGTTGKAPLREDAERAVVAALTADERAALLKGPLHGNMARLPHGWTRIEVARAGDTWTVYYNDIGFEVDVITGAVTRVRAPAAAPSPTSR